MSDFLYPAALFLIGAWSAAFPNRVVRRRTRDPNEPERFFEEKRAYDAYPWYRSPRVVRILGVLTMLGAVAIALLNRMAGR